MKRAERNPNLTIFRFDIELTKKQADFKYCDVDGLNELGKKYCESDEMQRAIAYLRKRLGY
jgi:hypothetical protein